MLNYLCEDLHPCLLVGVAILEDVYTVLSCHLTYIACPSEIAALLSVIQ